MLSLSLVLKKLTPRMVPRCLRMATSYCQYPQSPLWFGRELVAAQTPLLVVPIAAVPP
ncbi:MAG: hypothetical protein ACI9I4_000567 [Neolewinella sp.]|jgi:hypothetical protein